MPNTALAIGSPINPELQPVIAEARTFLSCCSLSGNTLSDIKVVRTAVTIYITAPRASTSIVFLYMLPLISCPVMELIIRHGTVIPITRLIKCFTDSSGSTLSLFAINPTPIYMNTTSTLLKIRSIVDVPTLSVKL